MSQRRRRFDSQQKAAILREHLIDRTPVSDLCDKHGIHPTVFYRWQKAAFENLPALFDRDQRSETRALESQVASLESKLARKDEIIAVIMEDLVATKKLSGGA
jgi:transposase-like protein